MPLSLASGELLCELCTLAAIIFHFTSALCLFRFTSQTLLKALRGSYELSIQTDTALCPASDLQGIKIQNCKFTSWPHVYMGASPWTTNPPKSSQRNTTSSVASLPWIWLLSLAQPSRPPAKLSCLLPVWSCGCQIPGTAWSGIAQWLWQLLFYLIHCAHCRSKRWRSCWYQNRGPATANQRGLGADLQLKIYHPLLETLSWSDKMGPNRIPLGNARILLPHSSELKGN